jgi:hypothetical protein
VYRPAYHVSEVYVRQVNITHVNVTNINVTNVNVTNVRYVNQSVNGAVTAVPQTAFVGARSMHTVAVPVSASAVAQAQVVGTAAPVAPERASVLGRAGFEVRVATPPARMVDRAVVAKTTPPPPPVSFGAKRDALMANPGRPIDPGTADTLRRNDRMQRAPVVRSATPGSAPQFTPPSSQQPVRPASPAMREVIPPPAQQQQQPLRNDRPNFRRPQQNDQPQQSAPVRPQPVQPQNTQQPQVQQPRFEQRQTPQQTQPQNQPPAHVESPRREVQPQVLSERPHVDQPQVRKEQQQEHKAERKERKEDRKDEKKQ